MLDGDGDGIPVWIQAAAMLGGGGILGAAIKHLIEWLTFRGKTVRTQERTALRQVWEIVDRQDRQLGEQQRDIARLYDQTSRCLVREEHWHSFAAAVVEGHNRMAAAMRKAGMDAPSDVVLPPREADADGERTRAEFLARSEQTNATLARDVADKVKGRQQP